MTIAGIFVGDMMTVSVRYISDHLPITGWSVFNYCDCWHKNKCSVKPVFSTIKTLRFIPKME